MKATLFALFVCLLMVVCGEPDLSDPDVVDWSKLLDRDGVAYLPNEETPYTGQSKGFHKNGQKKGEGNFKDGKRDGLWTEWHKNGQKWTETNWKDGKPNGLATEWYENGQKEVEANLKDGKLMSVMVWKSDGEKCPVTNVKDGDGVGVRYNEDGTEKARYTYKDGELVD